MNESYAVLKCRECGKEARVPGERALSILQEWPPLPAGWGRMYARHRSAVNGGVVPYCEECKDFATIRMQMAEMEFAKACAEFVRLCLRYGTRLPGEDGTEIFQIALDTTREED